MSAEQKQHHQALKKAVSDGVALDSVSDSSLAPPFNLKPVSMGETTAQTIDDSFQEVVSKKNNRREDKLLAKEKKQQQRVTTKIGKLDAASAVTESFKAPKVVKPANKTDDESQSAHDNTLTNEEDQSNSFEQTAGGSILTSLSKKKKQYLEQDIVDRSGAYKFEEDPSQYKKARKRLQNRESAVRSRMKKRQELEVLEVQVRKLMEEKAAVESANEELKRQNKYWEELFATQQLSTVQPATVQAPRQGASSQSSVGHMPNQSDFTRSDQSSEYQNGDGSQDDPSYLSMRMLSDHSANKRQKLHAESGSEMGRGLFDFERSSGLLDELEEPTYEKLDFSLPKNNDSSLQRQLSIENMDQRQVDLELEDCYLHRQPVQERRSSLFLGLALVFGAVGTMTTTMGPGLDPTVDTQVTREINSGSNLAGAGDSILVDSKPIKDGIDDDSDFMLKQGVTQTTPMQNVMAAFNLLWSACLGLPQLSLISLVLSLVFFVLYINPFSACFGQKSEKRRRGSTVKYIDEDQRKAQKVRTSSKSHKKRQSSSSRHRHQAN